jgi:hypothetical protein
MSTIRNPVGPQPPSVYWRRRLVVLLGLIAVIVVIVLIIVRPGSGTPASHPSNTATAPSGDPSSTPSPTFTSAAGGEECTAEQVKVVAVLDSTSYKDDEKPMLSMKITNQGAAPCTYDVGTGAQEYIITSGSDRIWDSKDCQKDPTSTPQVLQPGVELATEPFEWGRHRSTEEKCNGKEAVANSDGPTYRLQVKLGDSKSEEVAFRLF